LLAVLGGCGAGSGGDVTIDITHDICSPITVMTSTATAMEAAGIDDALALWRSHGVPSITRSQDAMIDIRFEDAAPNFFGVYDDEHSVIYINTVLTAPTPLSIVIAHELGHSFGLQHVTGRPSLMNPGNTTQTITADDVAELQNMWGTCPSPALPISASARPGS
jgi:predicted Zn-dependent protease